MGLKMLELLSYSWSNNPCSYQLPHFFGLRLALDPIAHNKSFNKSEYNPWSQAGNEPRLCSVSNEVHLANEAARWLFELLSWLLNCPLISFRAALFFFFLISGLIFLATHCYGKGNMCIFPYIWLNRIVLYLYRLSNPKINI